MIKKLFQLFTRNIGYKIASLILAIFIWGIIQAEQIQDKSIEIRVNIQPAPGYTIRGDMVQTKSATMRGPRVWMIDAPRTLEADLEIPAGKQGRYRGRIDRDKIKKWNQRFQLVIHDPYIDIFVDRKIERTVPIKEVLQGKTAEGYLIERINLEPRVVTLTGVREDLLKIRQVATEPIDIDGIKDNTSKEAKLIFPGRGVKSMNINVVNAHFKVGDSKINKRFGRIPIQVVGNDHITEVKPAFASIMVQGTPGVLNFIKRDDFRAFIEAQGLNPGRYEQEIKVQIPSDTVLIETFPEKGIVTILQEKRAE